MRLPVGDVPLTQPRVRLTPDPIHLDHRLGPLDPAVIIVSNAISSGILFTPRQIVASVPHAWLFLSTWVAGGLLAGAMAYAELAALRPRAGGECVYLCEAYGPLDYTGLRSCCSRAWLWLRCSCCEAAGDTPLPYVGLPGHPGAVCRR